MTRDHCEGYAYQSDNLFNIAEFFLAPSITYGLHRLYIYQAPLNKLTDFFAMSSAALGIVLLEQSGSYYSAWHEECSSHDATHTVACISDVPS